MSWLLLALAILLPSVGFAECAEGWVWISPPLDHSKGYSKPPERLANLPLQKWTVNRAFDTAAQCENARSDERERLLAIAPDQDWRAFISDGYLLSRCVPTRHIYPPWK